MPYYDIPSYAEYEGVYEPEFYEGACTWIACIIPDDKPKPKEALEDDEDFPF